MMSLAQGLHNAKFHQQPATHHHKLRLFTYSEDEMTHLIGRQWVVARCVVLPGRCVYLHWPGAQNQSCSMSRPGPPVSLEQTIKERGGRRGYDIYVSCIAKFIVPDWGDKANSGIGLSYRPARLHWLHVGPIRQPYAGVNYSISPRSGTKNLATLCM
jgi:hypothetical protein